MKYNVGALRALRSRVTNPTQRARLEADIRRVEYAGAVTDEQRANARYLFGCYLRAQLYLESDSNKYRAEFDEQRAALNVGTGAQGGDTVPVDFDHEIVEANTKYGRVESLANFIETVGGYELDVPAVTDPAVETATKTAEGTTYTETEETFLQYKESAYKYGTIAKASEEWWLDSGVDPVAFLAERGGRAISISLNTDLVLGNGTTAPQGLINNTVGVTLPSGNTTGVTYSGIVDLLHSIAPPYRDTGVWLMADATLKFLRKMVDTTNEPLFAGLQEGGQDMIFNRPAYADPDMPTMAANATSVYFGDVHANMLVRRIVPPLVKPLTELYALNGQTGFRIDRRVDAKLVDPAAGRLLQNSAT